MTKSNLSASFPRKRESRTPNAAGIYRKKPKPNRPIETEGADLKISRFRFAWKPSELMRRSLHITEI
ncbi:hypothetical protein, partial [Neisseria meningitidis]|uniref:hypothetical protein n=1 Tax=Neisseria meningitidis TaxID=487 RepID=UPI001E2E260F